MVHHARRGGGAWSRPEPSDGGADYLETGEAQRLTVSSEDRLGRALLATGFGYDPVVRARQAEVLRHVLPQVRDIRRIGSAALDLAYVACGRFDAYVETGISLWDIAAGSLLVENAGGTVDLRPRENMKDKYSIVASNGRIDLKL